MLKIDDHPYSPTLVQRIVLMGGMADSCDAAAVALQVVGEVQICGRTVNKFVTQIGSQMQADRDAGTQQYLDQPLPRKPQQVEPPIALAAVFCDGGRMRTRAEDQGRGVHEPHWRETKNAGFHRMQSESREQDPQPELPECFRNQAYVEKLVLGLKKARQPQSDLIERADPEPPPPSPLDLPEELPAWQPKTLFRTCLSSLASSDAFGPMMAAEAERRGFYTATKKVFVGDGQAYNWTIQQRWFKDSTAIADFVHVVEYVYEAAKALNSDTAARWQQYVTWADACWQGRVSEVITTLRSRLDALKSTTTASDIEIGKTLQSTLTYLTNNRERMQYPEYRRDALPVTSSLAESLVKQISKRVKGTEKFWNDGAGGEAILQVRAALLSDGDRLLNWIRDRPVSPYASRCRIATLATAS